MDSMEKPQKAGLKKWKLSIAVVLIIAVGIAFAAAPYVKYYFATAKLNRGLYEEAISTFESLEGFKDADNKVLESKYAWACSLKESHEYEEAISLFRKLKDYGDAKAKIEECQYDYACTLMGNGKYSEAIKLFRGLKNYNDSEDRLVSCKYNAACENIENGNYAEALMLLQDISPYEDSEQKIVEATYFVGKNNLDSGNYGVAVDYLERISECKDVSEDLLIARYNFAILCYDKGNLSKAKELFGQVGEYEDAVEYLNKIKFFEPLQGTYTSKYGDSSFVICGDTIYTIYHIESGHYVKDGTYVFESDFKVGQTKFNLFTSDFFLKNGVFYEDDSIYGTVVWEKSSDSTRVPKSDSFGLKDDPTVGMTAAEVKASSWGSPQEVNKTTTEYGVFEQWCYSNYRYIYFDNGIVSAIQE